MIQCYYLAHSLPSHFISCPSSFYHSAFFLVQRQFKDYALICLLVFSVISILALFSWFNINLRIMPSFVYLSSQSHDEIVPQPYFVFLTLMYLNSTGQVFCRMSLNLDLSEASLFIIYFFDFWLLHRHLKGILNQVVFKIHLCILDLTDVSSSDFRGSWLVNDILHKVIWSS